MRTHESAGLHRQSAGQSQTLRASALRCQRYHDALNQVGPVANGLQLHPAVRCQGLNIALGIVSFRGGYEASFFKQILPPLENGRNARSMRPPRARCHCLKSSQAIGERAGSSYDNASIASAIVVRSGIFVMRVT